MYDTPHLCEAGSMLDPDVALIELSKPVKLTLENDTKRLIDIICVPPTGSRVHANQTLTVAGWGYINEREERK